MNQKLRNLVYTAMLMALCCVVNELVSRTLFMVFMIIAFNKKEVN